MTSDLLARLEGATEDDIQILFEQLGHWAERNIEGFSLFRWHEFCSVGAFMDAALTLVPDGWSIAGLWEAADPKDRPWWGISFRRDETENVIYKIIKVFAAPTPAIALCIAALKARENGNG